MRRNGKCTTRTLAFACQISVGTAWRALKTAADNNDMPIRYARGHGRSGNGCLVGLTMRHHAFIYRLYLNNPSLPIDGYIEELFNEFSINVSASFVSRWFKTIGPFKGSI